MVILTIISSNNDFLMAILGVVLCKITKQISSKKIHNITNKIIIIIFIHNKQHDNNNLINGIYIILMKY